MLKTGEETSKGELFFKNILIAWLAVRGSGENLITNCLYSEEPSCHTFTVHWKRNCKTNLTTSLFTRYDIFWS